MQNVLYTSCSNLPETIYGKEYADKYGTLSFDIPNVEVQPKKSLLFHIYIDVSGSMSDIIQCPTDFITNPGRSKIQLLKHTLNNILYHFAEKCSNIYVQVKGFDDCIHNYIDPVEVTTKNIAELISKIEPIRPMNSTDIGLALTMLNKDIETEYFDIPIKNRVAILLTDGEPTSGICGLSELAEIVSKQCSHHFIGLGNQHNGSLLHKLGHKNIYTTNWFINDIEHTGNVYGEILFNETHRVIYETIIQVTGGKIYDFIKGEFVENLAIGTLYGETKKNYHLMIDDEENFNVIITGKDAGDLSALNISANKLIANDGEANLDINKQYIRLCVQKLMFNVRQDSIEKPWKVTINVNNRRPHDVFDWGIPVYEPKYNESLARMIDTFYGFITKFVKENNLEKDDFMIELLKDINVMKNSYRTIDGFKIVTAREDSQGRQTAFNTSSQYEDDLSQIRPPTLQRAPTSAYTTPGRCNLMRDISDSGYQKSPDLETHSPCLSIINPEKLTPPKLTRQSVEERNKYW